MRIAWSVGVGLAATAVLVVVLLLAGTHAPAAPTAGEQASRMAQVAQRVQAGQRGDGASVPGVSESDLRAYETATLGSAHATEHAANRAAEDSEPTAAAERYRAAAEAAPPSPGPPSQVGRWDAKFKIPTFAVYSILLPTGNVLWFSYENFANGGDPDRNTTQAYVWDPATKRSTRVDPPVDPKTKKPYNIWCSGHTFTEEGRVVAFGGNLELLTSTSDYKGLNTVFTFDPWTKKWVQEPNMRHGRWYPSSVRMPDGRMPILSGLDEVGKGELNRQVELFTPSGAMDGNGQVDLIGRTRPAATPDDTTLPPTGEYYPHLFSMASGRMLLAGPDHQSDTWFMDSFTKSSFTWKDAADMKDYRLWGNAVPLADSDRGPDRVMAVGGSKYFGEDDPSTPLATTEIFDENANPNGAQRGSWTQGQALNVGRAHANAVLLPDGSVAEVGGGIGYDKKSEGQAHGGKFASTEDQKRVELWNPKTGKWTLGPAQSEPRAYHSTALLLPDGRVISAGDDRNAKKTAGDTAEIYEPPYLHQGGTRPSIWFAPEAVQLGSTFGVEKAGPDIAGAALVAPGSVTHAVDMNQRYLPLRVDDRGNGCVDVKAPPTANAAPPGYYMLFLLDARGVPSVAKFVRVERGATLAQTCAQRHPAPPADNSSPQQPGVQQPAAQQPASSRSPSSTPASPAPAGPAPRGSRRIAVSFPGSKSLRVRSARSVAVRCRAKGTGRRTCAVKLVQVLRRGVTRVLGSGRATIAAGRSDAIVTVRLNATGRRLAADLRPARQLAVRADGIVTQSSGARGSARRGYRLTR